MCGMCEGIWGKGMRYEGGKNGGRGREKEERDERKVKEMEKLGREERGIERNQTEGKRKAKGKTKKGRGK